MRLRLYTNCVSRLIPKADRKLIHEHLFREGVLVAKKDFNLPKHGEIDTKNLYVRSLQLHFFLDWCLFRQPYAAPLVF